MGFPPRDPWYVTTSYPLDESGCCTYKGYDVRTQQGSRGAYSIQGVQGDAVPLPEREVSSQNPPSFSRAAAGGARKYLNSY